MLQNSKSLKFSNQEIQMYSLWFNMNATANNDLENVKEMLQKNEGLTKEEVDFLFKKWVN